MSEPITAASTAQEAWGQSSDIQWAREYVEKKVGTGRVIHAVLRPTQQAIDRISTALFRQVLYPCFWPLLILMSPCHICCCLNVSKLMAHMIYIVTNREVCRVVLDHSPPCPCSGCEGTTGRALGMPGRDTQTLPLQSIVSCQVERVGNKCVGCTHWNVDAVRINELGVEYGGDDGREYNRYYVQDPDRFVRLVNQLRDSNAQQHPVQNAYETPTSAPPAYGSPAAAADPIIASSSGLRIFVALATNPSQFEIIVNFQPHQGLDGLSKLVGDKFHQPGVRYDFYMAEIGASITDVQAIQANDKLIATKTI